MIIGRLAELHMAVLEPVLTLASILEGRLPMLETLVAIRVTLVAHVGLQ
jgi:hypothetical protein